MKRWKFRLFGLSVVAAFYAGAMLGSLIIPLVYCALILAWLIFRPPDISPARGFEVIQKWRKADRFYV